MEFHVTAEQEEAVEQIVAKWQAIANTTSPINRPKAAEAIKSLYSFMNRPEPEIFFCDHPFAWFLQHVHSPSPSAKKQRELGKLLRAEIRRTKQNFSRLGNSPAFDFKREIREKLWFISAHKSLGEVSDWLSPRLKSTIDSPYRNGPLLWGCLFTVQNQLNPKLQDWMNSIPLITGCTIHHQSWLSTPARLEILTHVFDFEIPAQHVERFEVLRDIALSCDYLFPFTDTCFVSDHPAELNLNHRNKLHAECQPAIIYRDGFKLYAYDGDIIPERYGKIPVTDWPLTWVKAEEEEMLRGILRNAIKDQLKR